MCVQKLIKLKIAKRPVPHSQETIQRLRWKHNPKRSIHKVSGLVVQKFAWDVMVCGPTVCGIPVKFLLNKNIDTPLWLI